jgi:hypothetical protein
LLAGRLTLHRKALIPQKPRFVVLYHRSLVEWMMACTGRLQYTPNKEENGDSSPSLPLSKEKGLFCRKISNRSPEGFAANKKKGMIIIVPSFGGETPFRQQDLLFFLGCALSLAGTCSLRTRRKRNSLPEWQ